MRERGTFKRIGIPEAEDMLKRPGVVIRDVRDAEAYRKGHVDRAQNVSTRNLGDVISSIKKTAPALIYCYKGNASQEYSRILCDFGFQYVSSLDGGYDAWRNRPPAIAMLEATLRQWLTEHGFAPNDINGVIANSTTPLMKASHRGEGAVVRQLIAAGAQLDTRNADGNNALWLACVGNHLDIIDILADAGVDIDNRNDNGATCLMYAASSGKPEVIGRLLARGADTGFETLDGFSALDLCSTQECLMLLRRATKARKSPAATS